MCVEITKGNSESAGFPLLSLTHFLRLALAPRLSLVAQESISVSSRVWILSWVCCKLRDDSFVLFCFVLFFNQFCFLNSSHIPTGVISFWNRSSLSSRTVFRIFFLNKGNNLCNWLWKRNTPQDYAYKCLCCVYVWIEISNLQLY